MSLQSETKLDKLNAAAAQIHTSIGGIEWNSFIDYPDLISIVLFVNGCNLQCEFCQNSYLISNTNKHSMKKIIDNLYNRKEFAEAVVLCGGEPTQQRDILKFAELIKSMGYKLKIDTNGANTEILKELCVFADYIALDVKTVFEKYHLLKASEHDIQNIKKSMEFLKTGSVIFEFRTTVYTPIVNFDDLLILAEYIEPHCQWYLQTYKARADINCEKRFDLEVESRKTIGAFCNILNFSENRIKVNKSNFF